ncbi:hypothetical protein SAMN05877838_3780 [Hoeflea halophila]|uniref:Uncharacterized protein n=1 Tax=Hoeflea halophila TaxID=714899 RepID=A0A286IGR0_9HYPH|nr:hypothetical protein [Hoeflea halophila]SOE18836.1 hypothetical protein SAMN05877838_3780 [Hoeflea halophila]
MTAEIAILTRSAVALAADSAVTVGKERVWKNTNKLFSVSINNDVGIMIWNSGDYCGVPWEIVIKAYRAKIRERIFDYLYELREDFVDFLSDFSGPSKNLNNLNLMTCFVNSIVDCCEHIDTISGGLKKRKSFLDSVELQIENAKDLPIINDKYGRDAFARLYSKMIKSFMVELAKIHVTSTMHSKMITLCYERSRRQYISSFETGVVFAGYGDKEIFPSLEEIVVDGKYGQDVRSWVTSTHNLNKEENKASVVIPFAQSDIAYLFMEGMQLDYLDFIHGTTLGILNEKSKRIVDEYVQEKDRMVERARQESDNKVLVKGLMDEFKKMRIEEVIKPMLRVVSSLPKEEMAAMAEALVEITSLRRKIDSKIESVGGPVDVAVISKSDGFVWIKRKHYFDLEINQDFNSRRTRKYGGSST